MNIIDVFDRVSGEYDSVGVDFFKPMAEAVVRAVAPRPGDRVLDLGCGRGAALLPAARLVGPNGHVTGIDLAPGMVTRTAAATSALRNVTVRIGDAQSPDFPNKSFDVITASMVLFFLPDPPSALTSYRRLLKPGGRLAFSAFAAPDPRHSKVMRILVRFGDNPPPDHKQHPMFGSVESLRSAMVQAGFDRTRVSELDVRSHFRDATQLVDWIGSHLGRRVLDAVPPDRRSEATEAVADFLDWPTTFTTRIRVVTGAV
ncbi:methyltransferase domain-containing protein [Actinoplanes sp. NPDC049596]|uniref:class I SAM-dependent methyltransferase n=1 Tax=unclassified Actinoplanes TaxID=2626549 RepID=UPI003423DCF6